MGLFGFIGDLLSKPKTQRQYYDDSIRDAIGPFTTRLSAAGQANDADVQQYSEAVRNAAQRAGQFDAEDVARIGGAIDRTSRNDGMAAYERLRQGNLAALKGFAGDLASMGLRDSNLALASRGYGSRAPGSYETSLRMDRISKNLAPVAGGIFSGLAPGVGAVTAAESENLSNLLGLIGARYGVPFRGANANLMPALARNSMLGDEIDNLAGLGDVARGNVAGFQIKDRPISNALKGLDSQLFSLLNTSIGSGAFRTPGINPNLPTPGAAPWGYSDWGFSTMRPPAPAFGTSSFTFTGRR